MIRMPPMMTRLAISAFACGALLACSEPASEPAPAPTQEPATDPDELAADGDAERASIIRPDIEIARTIELEPLELLVDFGGSGTDLTAEAVMALDELLESPQVAKFDGAITVRGHSDAGGADSLNLRMSQDRADAIAEWLVEQGVDEDRIKTIAFGEQNPVAPNALPDGTPDEDGRAANRRVEITVAVPKGATIPAPAEPSPAPAEESTAQSVTRQIAGS